MTLILMVHGSRVSATSTELNQLAIQLAKSSNVAVATAYMELQHPTLEERITELAAAGERQIRILPLFILAGRHALEDIPAQVALCRQRFPELELELAPHLGSQQAFLNSLVDIARSH
jgi:sirohydrochlorin cobaltochelatase